jgi:hypothetical protein
MPDKSKMQAVAFKYFRMIGGGTRKERIRN